MYRTHISILLYFLFFKYFIDYDIIVVSFFPPHPAPLIPLHPAHTLLPTFPHLSSCPWVIYISSLTSAFPILFLTSPCLFCTYHSCFLFPVPFPPFSMLLLPADNPPGDLYFCESVSVLVVCLVLVFLLWFFRFSCW